MTEVPARVLDFWTAFDRIEPIGDQWEQTATLAQTLSQGHAVTMACAGQELKSKPYTEFMPARWEEVKTPQKKPKSGMGLDAMRAKQERLTNA
jgi:hypothetical protein